MKKLENISYPLLHYPKTHIAAMVKSYAGQRANKRSETLASGYYSGGMGQNQDRGVQFNYLTNTGMSSS